MFVNATKLYLSAAVAVSCKTYEVIRSMGLAK